MDIDLKMSNAWEYKCSETIPELSLAS